MVYSNGELRLCCVVVTRVWAVFLKAESLESSAAEVFGFIWDESVEESIIAVFSEVEYVGPGI